NWIRTCPLGSRSRATAIRAGIQLAARFRPCCWPSYSRNRRPPFWRLAATSAGTVCSLANISPPTFMPGECWGRPLCASCLPAPPSNTTSPKRKPKCRPRNISRIQAEENHRWTPISTDSEGWTLVLLRPPLRHYLVNAISPWRSAVLSSSYLCPSVVDGLLAVAITSRAIRPPYGIYGGTGGKAEQ